MPRYIDTEKTDSVIQSELGVYDTTDLKEMLKFFPTEDVAPVVHAHWAPHLRKEFLYDHGPEFEFVDDGYACSNCRHYETFRTNYCSECGAKMDEDIPAGIPIEYFED